MYSKYIEKSIRPLEFIFILLHEYSSKRHESITIPDLIDICKGSKKKSISVEVMILKHATIS